MVKPPIGVRPENLVEEERIRDLGDAIQRHTEKGFMDGHYIDLLSDWCDELKRRLKRMR